VRSRGLALALAGLVAVLPGCSSPESTVEAAARLRQAGQPRVALEKLQ